MAINNLSKEEDLNVCKIYLFLILEGLLKMSAYESHWMKHYVMQENVYSI